MNDIDVNCPIAALKLLPGESLKVYLALKLFIQQGGTGTVLPNIIANNIEMSESAVVLRLVHLCVQGWLKININRFSDFFNFDKLIASNWELNDVHHLTLPNTELLNEAQNLTLNTVRYLAHDGTDSELEVAICDIKEEAKALLSITKNEKQI